MACRLPDRGGAAGRQHRRSSFSRQSAVRIGHAHPCLIAVAPLLRPQSADHIGDWERRWPTTRPRCAKSSACSANTVSEAAKIDAAYTLVNSPLVVSEFIAQIGGTRPERNDHRHHRDEWRQSRHARQSERNLRRSGPAVRSANISRICAKPADWPEIFPDRSHQPRTRENNDPLSFEISFVFRPGTP